MFHDVLVAVPIHALVIAKIDLHNPDTTLNEPPSHQAAVGKIALPIERSGRLVSFSISNASELRFASETPLHRMDPGLELEIVFAAAQMHAVQCFQRLYLPSLFRGRHACSRPMNSIILAGSVVLSRMRLP